MRLSELTTDRAADVLCELTPYIANITGDKTLLDELGKKFDPEGKSPAELYVFADAKYAQIVPILLKSHRADVFGILGTLNEQDAESIGKQNIMQTMRQVRDAVQDKDLMDFFGSLQGQDESA